MSENHNIGLKGQLIPPHRQHPSLYSQRSQHGHVVAPEHVTSHQVQMHPMHLPGQIDDVHAEPQIHASDAPQMPVHYMQDHEQGLHPNSGSGMDDDQDEDGGSEDMEGDVPSDPTNLADPNANLPSRNQATNQLSLSFQGEVYVFDSVSPEKVQAVLLLLGGREIPTGLIPLPLDAYHSSKGLSDVPQRLNLPQRIASLTRFREKRKERNFEKKIRYTVRKEVALRMHRNKGQFTSSKASSEEAAAIGASLDPAQTWSQDSNRFEETLEH